MFSQLKSFFTPTQNSSTTTITRRINPRRNAKKQLDDNFIYPGFSQSTNQESTNQESISLGSTLNESELCMSQNDKCTKHFVPETLPVEEGNNSLSVYYDDSQTVVRDTQSPIDDFDNLTSTPAYSQCDSRDPLVSAGRFRSLFSRRLNVSSTSDTQPLLVPETQLDSEDVSCSVTPSQDLDASVPNSSDDTSSLLLTQQSQAVVPPPVNSGETIATVVSDRLGAPVSDVLANHTPVQLFRGPHEPLSAFFHHPLRWKNRTFISAEQAYQYSKLVHHKVSLTFQNQMLRCKSSHACKQLAYKCVKRSIASWDLVKFVVMEEICTAKFRQCRRFKEALRKSDGAFLLHNTESDSVWGCGPNLKGLNKMGHILMNVRRKDIDYAQEFPPLPQASTETARPQSPAKTRPQSPAKTASSSVKSYGSPPKVVILGNSNTRGLSQRLCTHGVTGTGYVYPGQTAEQVTRRVKSINLSAHTPSAVLLHAGDIEVRNPSHSVSSISKNIRSLVETVKSESPNTAIIISGLPHVPGENVLNRRIASVNSASSHLCHNMNNVYFVSNKTAALQRDQIHLTFAARDLIGRNIAYLVKQCI